MRAYYLGSCSSAFSNVNRLNKARFPPFSASFDSTTQDFDYMRTSESKSVQSSGDLRTSSRSRDQRHPTLVV